MKGFSLQMLES